MRLMATLEARGRRESLKFADITAQLVSSVLRALILCVVACGCMKPLEVAGFPCKRRAQFVFEYFSLCMASMQCAHFVYEYFSLCMASMRHVQFVSEYFSLCMASMQCAQFV